MEKQDSEENVRLDKPFDISSAEALEKESSWPQHPVVRCGQEETRPLAGKAHWRPHEQ